MTNLKSSRLLSSIVNAKRITFMLLAIFLSASNALAETDVRVHYLMRDIEPPLPLSLIDTRIEKDGFAGADLGLRDNQTTGSFLGHNYELVEVLVPEDADLVTTLEGIEGDKPEIIFANLEAVDILQVTDAYPDALVFNVRARDDRIRHEDCRSNLLHLPPTRSMLTDALAQYLAWKRWDKVIVVKGRHPEDALYAQALERAVKRFGLKVVDRKDWTAIPGARRTDSGHHSAQQEIPSFTRFKDHDVLLVADEIDEFGEYLSYRMQEPRPVAGTQGLTPTSWHRAHEQWGATQIQRRFTKIANRNMSELDYSSWLAMRTLGEAVTNTGSSEPAKLKEFIFSKNFKLAGFKGKALTFRTYNGQLRQPVLIVSPRMLITVSPQQGFLHQVTELDTLGIDEPESACTQF
ncbi:MAG: ABC transporter substrate-binding protein [Granulosicoccus sp.]|nr:ABC transporter substrate-binding protein [Granulosicoccus sp.]